MKYQHCLLLPFALILIGAGLITLLYFGIGNLEPYTHTKDFRAATCVVTYSNISTTVPCTHYDTGDLPKVRHKSTYPCLVVLVNYTEEEIQMDAYGYPVHQPPSYSEPDRNATDDDPHAGAVDDVSYMVKTDGKKTYIHQEDVMLYEDYESWAMTRKGGSNATCSVHVCHADPEDNEHDVDSFEEDHGQVGQIVKCYFSPKDHTEVYSEVVSGNLVLHALVWPALAMGFGFFLLVVVAFLSCEVWICRNPKRAQRRMQGQTYELASYRENSQQTSRGWRHSPPDGRKNTDRTSRNMRPGDGNNNSRLPKLSAAADIVRKWSQRGRSDRRSDASDTARTSRSYGGVPTRQWSISKADQTFCTT